jgi:transcriptional regulator with XRE-family HTH domain
VETLAERLLSARLAAGMTQDQLAARAHVAQGTIGNLEAGIRKSARRVAVLAAVLQVNPLWLAEGKGPRHAHVASEPTAPPYSASDNLLEQQLLELFRQLPAAAQHEAVAVVNSIHAVVFPDRSRANPFAGTSAARRGRHPTGR